MKDECYFCARACEPEDFCFGCSAYVCEKCDERHPLGRHDPEDHVEHDVSET